MVRRKEGNANVDRPICSGENAQPKAPISCSVAKEVKRQRVQLVANDKYTKELPSHSKSRIVLEYQAIPA